MLNFLFMCQSGNLYQSGKSGESASYSFWKITPHTPLLVVEQ